MHAASCGHLLKQVLMGPAEPTVGQEGAFVPRSQKGFEMGLKTLVLGNTDLTPANEEQRASSFWEKAEEEALESFIFLPSGSLHKYSLRITLKTFRNQCFSFLLSKHNTTF